MKITTNNELETINTGTEIASSFSGGDIILLEGNLGAGKTTITKGIANFFKIKEDITSPTFTLMNVYEINSKNIRQLVHIDTYRLEDEQDLIDIGIEDYLEDNNTICLIEWPDKIKDLLKNKKTRIIKIEHLNEEKREIKIT